MVFQKVLQKRFYNIGFKVGSHPKIFIIVPIILTVIFSTGFINFNFNGDFVYLFSSQSDIILNEENLMLKYFKQNESGQFDPSRKSSVGHLLRVGVSTKNMSNILNSKVWNQILLLDQEIHNITATYNGEEYNFRDICSRWGENCYPNYILKVGILLDGFEKGETEINFPLAVDPIAFETIPTGHFLKGVEFKGNDSSFIASAKVVSLHYFLATDVDDPESKLRAATWEQAAANVLVNIGYTDPRFNLLEVYVSAIQGVSDEASDNIIKVIPYIAVAEFLVGMYAVLSMMMKDWVTSKPWLGFAAVSANCLGLLAGLGFMQMTGVEFIAINMGVPFIMLAVGIDDAFVLLAAWRSTSTKTSVPERMGATYATASVSITLTTVTDMASFFVGLLTPLKGLRIFCLYAGATIVFIYFWQLFMFGACLALSGYHEKKKRHGLFFWREVITASQADKLSPFQKWLWKGGDDSSTGYTKHWQMEFFRNQFANFLFKTPTKIAVALILVAYWITSIYGMINIDISYLPDRLYRYDSWMYHYEKMEDEYTMKGYSYRYQVLITEPVDYSNTTVQKMIQDALDKYTQIEFITSEFSDNWLRDFLRWAEIYKEFEDIDISTKQGFIDTLRNKYLSNNSPLSTDVVFNENYTEIIASRFILQVVRLSHKAVDVVHTMVKAREIAANETNLKLSAYLFWNSLVDQMTIILGLSIKLIGIASIVVTVVAAFFMPSATVVFCVFLTILSTEIGVVGFMTLWQVSLDPSTLGCLIMCIGFAVDFAAHMSYAFVSSEEKDFEEKLRSALHSVGVPIFQGATSTIITLAPLLLVPSYTFGMFSKVFFLVIIFSFLHTIFVLPVFFILFNDLCVVSKFRGKYEVNK